MNLLLKLMMNSELPSQKSKPGTIGHGRESDGATRRGHVSWPGNPVVFLGCEKMAGKCAENDNKTPR